MYKEILFLLMLVMFFSFASSCKRHDEPGSGSTKTVMNQNDIPKEPEKDSNPENKKIEVPKKAVDPVEEQIKSMTLDEKIGQMIITGLDGYEIDDNSRKMIENYYVGGFILFSQNIDSPNQTLNLINSLKNTNLKNKIPLFLSVDEEGGRVSRLPVELKKLPSNETIGHENNDYFSFKIGSIIAEEIKSLGLNMDFAPVLDINSNPENPVIGDRSFGSNPEIVSRLGVQTMRGIQSENVIPVVKHFPGHGDTAVDSHCGLPSLYHDLKRLEGFELIPFTDAINSKSDAVMIAHILLHKIDPQNPSSLSKIIITDILRNKLKFNGVVITDDMTMGAITENYDISDAAIKSVNAGSDIILVCHNFDTEVAVINAMRKAAEDGTISKDRIDKSLYRILKLKQKYNLNNRTIDSIDVEKINNKISEFLMLKK